MQSWIILILAALLCAGASAFVLTAYRRAEGGAEARPLPALILCGVGAAVALGVYMLIGRPDLADRPYAERMAALETQDPMSFTADETLAVLGKAARENPRDARPHIFTGDILLEVGRPEDAARAYDAALRRDPNAPDALIGMGKALVRIDEGRVSPEALAAFQAAAEAAPADPRPWLYQAMAAMQAGDEAGLRRNAIEAGRRMDPDDPRQAMIAQMQSGALQAGP